MLGNHRAADGTVLPIAEMDDGWLGNMILKVCRGILEMKQALLVLENESDRMKKLENKLYNRPQMTEEQLTNGIREAMVLLTPYLAEAFLRPVVHSRCLQMVQKAIGRTGALPRPKTTFRLSSGHNQAMTILDLGDEDYEDDGDYNWMKDSDEGDRQ